MTVTDHTYTPSLDPSRCLRCGTAYADHGYLPLVEPEPVAYRCSICGRSFPPGIDHEHRMPGRPAAHARNTDPDTSHAAARSVRNIRASQAEVLALYRAHGPMTDETVASVYRGNQSPSGLRTRRAELVRAGSLRDTGRRTVGSTGRRMIVWDLTR